MGGVHPSANSHNLAIILDDFLSRCLELNFKNFKEKPSGIDSKGSQRL